MEDDLKEKLADLESKYIRLMAAASKVVQKHTEGTLGGPEDSVAIIQLKVLITG